MGVATSRAELRWASSVGSSGNMRGWMPMLKMLHPLLSLCCAAVHEITTFMERRCEARGLECAMALKHQADAIHSEASLTKVCWWVGYVVGFRWNCCVEDGR